MFDIDRWQEIFSSIRSNILRTILSGVTVALGLFIFIVLFGIGNGLQNSFQSEFNGDASNLITIFSTQTSKPYAGMQSNRTITMRNSDYKEITEKNKAQIEYASPRYRANMMVKYGKESGNYQISGSNSDEIKIENRLVTDGRYINPADETRQQKVAVIGRLVQKDLIKNGSPIGKIININGSSFTVVGVFSDSGGDWDERMITVPLSTLQMMKKSSDTLNTLFVTYDKKLSTQQAIDLGNDIKKDMKSKHRVDPTDDNGIIVRNNAENMKDTLQFILVLTIIVGVIGGGTLIAGIIGISNIMVYIIKERTKEIGVRKAIGARPKSIVALILQESIVITVISGIIGVLLGVLTLNLLGNSLEPYFIKEPNVGTGTVIFAFLCLVMAGGIAGFVPAYRASKIKPIEALRTE